MASQNVSKPHFLNWTASVDFPYIIPSYTLVWSFFLFPLCFLVLHTSFQRWRENKHSTVSHADFFTYLILFFELLLFCSYFVSSIGILQPDDQLQEYGSDIANFAAPGVLALHVLTCVERYLAVVYPVVYLSLRKRRWMLARNLIIFIILAFCVLWCCMMQVIENTDILIFSTLGTVTGIIMFCSVQVLRALRNPSPGEGRGVSKSKRKAFFTMSIILSTLMLWFLAEIIVYAVNITSLEPNLMKMELYSVSYVELPSSLVLPLLFLHRAGKLPKCRGKKVKKPALEQRGGDVSGSL